jgi:surfeit locus 1 family protein
MNPPQSVRPDALTRLRSPRFWVLTVATWAMVALTFSLGRWQMHRADYKQSLAEAVAARGQEAALDERVLLKTEEPARDLHRRVELQGQWLPGHTIYLDNRPMQSRPGFWVLTPLQLEGSPRAILVQRGWIPRDFADRSRLAPVQTPAGTVQVSGRMALSPGKLYEFKGEDTGRIRQNLDIASFRAETGLDLLQALVVQTGVASEGLQRDWDAPDTGVDKHHGYAFQWFVLSALLIVLYAWFQVVGPALQRKNARRDD